ncbi:hypothetical protein BUALT_Bualt14G0115600 [Buddleja alternifolia]|uniref:Uncharacterized protein n=1 Tax=Buddleja alternifolia TaxID=168488 RepID=A0AAV6WQS8_9LAMI|nr:hypothetical protein BUALT_Bualt14G0115600 [Buddleja alternifolia]
MEVKCVFVEQLRGFQELIDQGKATGKYLEWAKKHGLSLVELALAFARTVRLSQVRSLGDDHGAIKRKY